MRSKILLLIFALAFCAEAEINIPEILLNRLNWITRYTLCPPLEEPVLVAHPNYCNRYFVCESGQDPLEFMCAPGLAFDVESATCYDKTLVDCNVPICRNIYALVNIADRNDCTKYYLCNLGTEMPRDCFDNLHFSFDNQTCIDPDVAMCVEQSICENTETNPDLIPHPSDCSKYYICSFGEAIPMQCEGDLWFNDERNECVPKNESFCGEFTTIAPGENPCEGVSGVDYVPHPDDCTLYYICVNGQPTLQECPAPFWFNPYQKQCMRREDSGCGVYSTTLSTPDPVSNAPNINLF